MPRLRHPRLRRTLAIGATCVACVLAILTTQPLWAYDILAGLLPGVLWRVHTDRPLVALTFDDGPDPTYTPQVLEILERHGARGTFFLIAERALPRPDLVARIRAGGHEVANHYATRRSALKDSDQEFAEKLALAGRVLGLDGTRPLLFRPPGGLARPGQLARAREAGYTVVLGSAYPWDPAPPPTAYIRWLVSKNLAPGAIVILHDGIEDPSRSIAALHSILETGAARGLRFVPVGEILERAESPRRSQRAKDSRREASESGIR